MCLSQKDRERAVYGLKEKNLAKVYIKLIGLNQYDPDAIRLLNWKKPTEREVRRGAWVGGVDMFMIMPLAHERKHLATSPRYSMKS